MKKTIIIAVTHEWNEYLKEFNNIEYYYHMIIPFADGSNENKKVEKEFNNIEYYDGVTSPLVDD